MKWLKMLLGLWLLSLLGCILYEKGEIGFEIVSGFKFTHETSTTNSRSEATIDFPSIADFIGKLSDSSQDDNNTAGTGG